VLKFTHNISFIIQGHVDVGADNVNGGAYELMGQ